MSLNPNTPGFRPAQAYYGCGHPKTLENTRIRDTPCCAMCRRQLERKASRKARVRRKLFPAPIARIMETAASADNQKLGRWAAMLALRDEGLSLLQIGRLVGRHHTTVMYGLDRARHLRSRDADFIDLLEEMGV